MRAPAFVEEDTMAEGATDFDAVAAGVDDGVTGVDEGDAGSEDEATERVDAGDACTPGYTPLIHA
jgi:hypothetical protein